VRELLADYTTLRLGGPADSFVSHTDPSGWLDIARAARERGQPRFVLTPTRRAMQPEPDHAPG
jgi:UDP-N-acetylmuramate dehydrogenase